MKKEIIVISILIITILLAIAYAKEQYYSVELRNSLNSPSCCKEGSTCCINIYSGKNWVCKEDADYWGGGWCKTKEGTDYGGERKDSDCENKPPECPKETGSSGWS